jgi:hypothetical protein
MNALRRWAPLLGVGLLLVASWAASVLSSPELNSLPVPPLATATEAGEAVTDEAPTPADEENTRVDLPDETSGFISIAVLVVAVLVAGTVTWVLVRKRIFHTRGSQLVVQRPSAPRRSQQEDVVEAINAGLTALSDLEADARGAVIACWVRLEGAAAIAGTPRLAADSPTDLVARLLVSHSVSPGVLEGLAAVYREARFATHPISEGMRATALNALRQIRSELGQGQDPGVPGGSAAARRGEAARYATASQGGAGR